MTARALVTLPLGGHLRDEIRAEDEQLDEDNAAMNLRRASFGSLVILLGAVLPMSESDRQCGTGSWKGFGLVLLDG